MAKIGDVEFNVLDESRNFSNDVTRHPVEKGADITDHVENQPISYTINGIIGDDDDPATAHGRLTTMWRNREPVYYIGRSTLKNCIVESFTSDVDSNSIKGFTFSITITQVRIAEPSTVGLLPTNLKVDMEEVGSAGRVQAS